MNIPESYPEILERRRQLSMIMPGGPDVVDLVFRDFTAAVINATSYKLKAGGVAMELSAGITAHREAWTVFMGVWVQTSDLEQCMAQVDGYLAQDPDARALGGEFYLYGWQLERDKRILAGLGKRRGDPAA